MNTTFKARRDDTDNTTRHAGRAKPAPETQQALCLNLTADDPAAGAAALFALQKKLAPTLVIAGEFGVQAYWIFDPPNVPPAQLRQFAEALAHAASDCGLHGSARISEIVAGNTVSAADMSAVPDYQPEYPIGPCPLPYDWTRKNLVGVSTKDRERARQWCIDAMLAGYAVSHTSSKGRGGGSHGTIAQIQTRRREEIAQEKTRQESAANADPKVSSTMAAMFDKLMGDDPQT